LACFLRVLRLILLARGFFQCGLGLRERLPGELGSACSGLLRSGSLVLRG
jgi:hypothetical protein